MTIKIEEVVTKTDMKKFVNLQFELYKGNKFWTPPIKKEEIEYLNPQQNPLLKFADAKFYLAYKNNKVVGRIGAVVSHIYNKKINKKMVRFTKPEFIDDQEVFDALMNKVIDYGKEKGMDRIHGPLGFSNIDKQGLLIEGFEEIQSVASVYHLPYYKKYIEKMGFVKENDWVEFNITLEEDILKKANRGATLIKRRYGFETIDFTTTKKLFEYAPAVFEVLNEAFADLPYVVEFDTEIVKYYTKKYFDILNPKYVKIVKKDDEVIGFIIAVPSMSKAMQKASGNLFPFGIFSLIKARKKNDVAELFLIGVKKKYLNAGVGVILFSALQNTIYENGINTIETTGIFETNMAVITAWKNYKHIQHKRRRCYVKSL